MRPLLVALALPFMAAAQQPLVRHYGPAQDLKSENIQDITQSPDGFLWVATVRGLYRFDGISFQHFGQADGLPEPLVEAVFQSPDGTLWAAGPSAISYWDGRRFQTVLPRRPAVYAAFMRHAIAPVEDGRVLLRDGDKRLHEATRRNGVWTARPVEGIATPVDLLHTDSEGRIWAVSWGRPVCRIVRERTRYRLAEPFIPVAGNETAGDILVSGDWLVLRTRFGLWRYSISAPSQPPREIRTPGNLWQAALIAGPGGKLLFSTPQGLMETGASDFEPVRSAADAVRTAGAQAITAAFVDREGSIWIGDEGKGLFQIPPSKWSHWRALDGAPLDRVETIGEALGGIVAGSRRAIYRVTGGASLPRLEDTNLSAQQVLGSSRALAVAANPGIHCFEGGAWKRLRGEAGSQTYLRLLPDGGGGIWGLTPTHFYRNRKGLDTACVGSAWEKVNAPAAAQWLNGATVDAEGRLWLYHSEGLSYWWGGDWHDIPDSAPPAYVEHDTVSVAEAGPGRIWVAFDGSGGMIEFLHTEGRWKRSAVAMPPEARGSGPLFVGRDASGKVWLGAPDSISSWDGRAWATWTAADLGAENETLSAFYIASDGSIWVGASSSLHRLPPGDAPPVASPGTAVFSELWMGGQRVHPGDAPVVRFENGRLSASLAPLTLARPAEARYRYRLTSPFARTPAWVETDSPALEFAGLFWGEHSLEACVRTGAGDWSAPAVFRFHVDRPWYLSWWVLMHLGLVMAVGVHGLSRWRTRRRLEETRRLTALVEVRTRELEEARCRAETANGQKSRFLAYVSHEIRTPMSGVLGMLRLARDSRLASKRERYLRVAGDSASSVVRLLDDLLDVAQAEAGRLSLSTAPAALEPCILGVVDTLEAAARERGIAIHTKCDPLLPPWVAGDEHRLRQVLLNLVSNAIRHTPLGSVRVEASVLAMEPGAVTVRFAVTDSGEGIGSEQLESIFEPFQSGAGRSGLGLTISRDIARAMGGELRADSRPGIGSRFWFDLEFPLCSPPGIDSGAARPRPGVLRVLVVDDEPVSRDLSLAYLDVLGHEAEAAASGEEALAKLEQSRGFDVVLMDTHMPGMGGAAAARAIREIERKFGHRVAIIAATGATSAEDRAAQQEAGMDGFLAKPFGLSDLERVLERAASMR